VITRQATFGDAARIKELIDLYVPSGTLLPRTQGFIEDHAEHFVVALEGRDIVGCVHLDEYAPSLAEIRSVAVDPRAQGRGVGVALVQAAEALARLRGYHTLFAVSDNDTFFLARGFTKRHIPELDRERSEVSRWKGVYAKDLVAAAASSAP
jgi:N-acetylglutamate synthase-like GNAT family acetyltransferase